jgi:hypothetical protein
MGVLVLVEIRRYEIEPGRRDEFVDWFEADVLPAMEQAGMEILGVFVDVEDPNVFFYLKGFESEAERGRINAAFYESDLWLNAMKARALEMETGYEVSVVRSTDGSSI